MLKKSFTLVCFIYLLSGCGGSSSDSNPSLSGTDLTAGNGYNFEQPFSVGSTSYEKRIWAEGTGLDTPSIMICDPKIKDVLLPDTGVCIEITDGSLFGTESYLLKEFYADVNNDGKADGTSVVTTNLSIWFDNGSALTSLGDELIAENSKKGDEDCRQVINTGQGSIIKSIQQVCSGSGLVRTYTSQGTARPLSELDDLIAELDSLNM